MREGSPPGSERAVHHRLESAGIEMFIARTVICLTCGRNLKLLPVVGVCPECGKAYSARGLTDRNVHRPGTIPIPVADMITLALVYLPGLLLFGLELWLVRQGLIRLAWPSPFAVVAWVVLSIVLAKFLTPREERVSEWLRAWRLERPHREEIRAEEEQAASEQAAERARGSRATHESATISTATYKRLRQMGYSFEVDWPVVCATCGYSLRGLSVVGVCPECGKEYNARPMKMINVRNPYGSSLPWGNIWSAVTCGMITMVLVQSMMSWLFWMTALLAAVFGVATVVFVRLSLRGIQEHRDAMRALQQMEEE